MRVAHLQEVKRSGVSSLETYHVVGEVEGTERFCCGKVHPEGFTPGEPFSVDAVAGEILFTIRTRGRGERTRGVIR